MLSRATAIEAIAGQHFEVVVIGGGITGAGVALDAASRGYSVALLERGDYADRHLQPLLEDGPRRPALPAEPRPRPGPRGAARAPADGSAGAAPGLPDAVPGPLLRRRAPRPQARDRAQHVRRDGDDAGRSQPPRDALLQGGRRGLLLVARPPPHDRPRRGAGAGPGAGAARSQERLPLLRLPDRRRAPRPDRARRGRALRRGDAERCRGGRGTGARAAVPPVSPSSRPARASGSRSTADNVVNATGVFADRIRPEETIEEEDVPRIAPSRGTHLLVDRADLRSAPPPASSRPARAG